MSDVVYTSVYDKGKDYYVGPYKTKKEKFEEKCEEAKAQYELCSEIISGLTSAAAQLDLSIESLDYANGDFDRFQKQLKTDVIDQQGINNIKLIFNTLHDESKSEVTEIGKIKDSIQSLYDAIVSIQEAWWKRHKALYDAKELARGRYEVADAVFNYAATINGDQIAYWNQAKPEMVDSDGSIYRTGIDVLDRAISI